MNKIFTKSFWDKVQYCDTSILYALFALFMVAFEFTRPYMPVPVPKPVQMLYDRVEAIYKEKVDDTPAAVYDTFAAIRTRLAEAKAKHGDNISPFDLEYRRVLFG